MLESKQATNNQSENINRTTIDQSCVGTTSEDMGGVSSTQQANRTTIEESRSDTTKSRFQPENGTKNGKINPALSRALIGGLIGGTLGSLAGALAGRRIGEGFNHTMRGVQDAAKTIGEGLGQTARGVGDVAKSFAEGASHAVVGDVSDALDVAQGAAEGVKQTAVNTLNALQNTVQDINEATSQKTQTAAENTRPWENGGKQDSQQTQNQDIGMGQREIRTQSIYISTPEYAEGYVGESTTFVNDQISVEPFEDISLQEEINRIDS
ncbi:MAG TPA: hypothetical protein VE956_07535 [Nodularia sp. (in: cyanobacteria)]|nr:hypothetical protein [Nodularia sp. (in: cyanobacteria)]